MTIGFLTEEDREILVEINGEKVSKYVANSGGYNKVGTLTIPVSLKRGSTACASLTRITLCPILIISILNLLFN